MLGRKWLIIKNSFQLFEKLPWRNCDKFSLIENNQCFEIILTMNVSVSKTPGPLTFSSEVLAQLHIMIVSKLFNEVFRSMQICLPILLF